MPLFHLNDLAKSSFFCETCVSHLFVTFSLKQNRPTLFLKYFSSNVTLLHSFRDYVWTCNFFPSFISLLYILVFLEYILPIIVHVV